MPTAPPMPVDPPTTSTVTVQATEYPVYINPPPGCEDIWYAYSQAVLPYNAAVRALAAMRANIEEIQIDLLACMMTV